MPTKNDPLRRIASTARLSHIKRAEAVGQTIDYTIDQLHKILRDDIDDGCEYCHCALHYGNVSIDHAVPTSRKGSFSIENIRLVCKPCNTKKGALTEEEYTELLEMMKTWSAEGSEILSTRLMQAPAWKGAKK